MSKAFFMQWGKVLSFLLVVALLALGCIHTEVTRIVQSDFPPVSPDEVQIYLTPEDIKGEYEKIALIHAQGGGSWTNEQMMIKECKKKAASLGANGIILGGMNEPSAGAKVAATIFGTTTTRRGHVIAVHVYQDSPPSYQRDRNMLESHGIYLYVKKVEDVETEAWLNDEPETQLPYFRIILDKAEGHSDREILTMYRSKYQSLKHKSDTELISLIEKAYKSKFEKKLTSDNQN